MESDDFLGKIENLLELILDKVESIGNLAYSREDGQLNHSDINYIMYQTGQAHGHLKSMEDAIKAWRADNGI